MNVLIIEDEKLAQDKLEKLLHQLDPEIHVLARLGSVKDSIRWLSTNPSPDLGFVDIQLSDDHSFEIFRQLPVEFPVIFTTAYDKYLLESFEYNSIDYLFKPITEDKLKRALEKVKRLEHHFTYSLKKVLNLKPVAGTQRIVARKGTEYITLAIDEIAYFYTEHKIVFVRDFEGKRFIVNDNLGELETRLDGQQFFRLNRKYIANIKSIERFKPDSGKIRISLNPSMNEDIHVSKENAPEFRKWIGVIG
jgi:DNA-binding LytR/AlgR family response regulator